ncbi:MFS transporter [Rhizobiaceae bacterium BDR2-2]|uniref:MFS transporter n=1 Tax=Ectorhizobium quercum TaxID=2965071 RepID=A0AAE3SV68_9HYPH|nr:YbfB/YjiJ family MFS transporter [Ectorhizobium quercum]MCX8996639.1 MFS transporter [Ectorhizobium quercum]
MTVRTVRFPSLFLLGLTGALALASSQGLGRFFYTPVLPGMMASLGLSPADAGLIAAANFAGYLIGALLAAQSWAAGRERSAALAGLLATAVLMALMAWPQSLAPFIAIRFLAGLASAFALIFTSAIVLELAARAGSATVPSAMFGGVGLGISLSSLIVMAVYVLAGGSGESWRPGWLTGSLLALAIFALAAVVLPKPQAGARKATEPELKWRPLFVIVAAAYCCFGFGYIVSATFLVAIARQAGSGQWVEFSAWFATGIACFASLFAWQPLVRRRGADVVFAICMVLLAAGTLASVLLPARFAVVAGGILLGCTFMVITSCGLATGRTFAPESPRRAMGVMTAIFGVGQIAGPLVGGWAADISGSFLLPSVIAAGILMIGAALLVPVITARRQTAGR